MGNSRNGEIVSSVLGKSKSDRVSSINNSLPPPVSTNIGSYSYNSERSYNDENLFYWMLVAVLLLPFIVLFISNSLTTENHFFSPFTKLFKFDYPLIAVNVLIIVEVVVMVLVHKTQMRFWVVFISLYIMFLTYIEIVAVMNISDEFKYTLMFGASVIGGILDMILISLTDDLEWFMLFNRVLVVICILVITFYPMIAS